MSDSNIDINTSLNKTTSIHRILIVDDSVLILGMLMEIFKDSAKLNITGRGDEALEIAENYQPDVILLDVIMPDMDGFDVLAELKASDKTKNIPVIFMTAESNPVLEEKGLNMGAVDFVNKTLSKAVIRLRVMNQLRIVHQFRDNERLRRNLEKATHTAQIANKTKSSFLARMSHEIRTPMNAIIGITEALARQTIESPKCHECNEGLQKIRSASELLLGIINDILDLSKIEAGKLELKPVKYDLASLIYDTMTLNVTQINTDHVNFKVRVGENIPMYWNSDFLRLKQILNNVLSNAAKYTQKGKIVFSVELAKPADDELDTGSHAELIFTISDTGSGMSSEQVDMLFDEYSRFTDNDESASIEGTGLGMSITLNLVSLFGGKIEVQSELGVGSTFTLKIPQEKAGEQVLSSDAVRSLEAFDSDSIPKDATLRRSVVVYKSFPHLKILVVDDTKLNLYVVEGLLKPYDLQLTTVASGFEAIDLIINQGKTYDIIFMDHMMPKMSGIQAAKHIQDSGYTGAIIALTANALEGAAEMFIKNGFDDFLSKPIDTRKLDAVLKKYARKSANIEKTIDTSANVVSAISNTPKANQAESADAEPVEIYRNTSAKFLTVFASDAKVSLSAIEPLMNLLSTSDDALQLSKEDEIVQEYAVKVHSMRGACVLIGEDDLAAKAKELELAALNGEFAKIRKETTAFADALKKLIERANAT
ncbi:MAG: response regulator [Oscillospiraceae bacterium]|nr:response regulator [Oscillospiraceae bacterium]